MSSRPAVSRAAATRSTLLGALTFAGVLPACTPTTPAPPVSPTVVVAEPVVAASAGPAGYRCDGVAYDVDGRDYCAHTTPAPWADAKATCSSEGGQLASFGSPDEARGVLFAFGSPVGAAEALWLGLFEPREGTWEWTSAAPLSFTHWSKGEPNNDGGNENCAEWRLGTGAWNDAPCGEYRGYVCERAIPKGGAASAMSCGGRVVQGKDSEYCFNVQQPATWREAKDACAAAGQRLATPSTEDQDRELHRLAGPRLGLASVWVGLSDSAREGSWKWLSREGGRSVAWKPGEPNDFHGEDCAEWFSEDGLMNDLSCLAKRPFLCERVTSSQ